GVEVQDAHRDLFVRKPPSCDARLLHGYASRSKGYLVVRVGAQELAAPDGELSLGRVDDRSLGSRHTDVRDSGVVGCECDKLCSLVRVAWIEDRAAPDGA